jgi:hypothetical protein
VLAVQLKATECWTATTPVPESEMLIGELLAVLVIATLPDTVLPLEGVNVTVKVAVCPAPTTWLAATPEATKPAPVSVTVEIVTLVFPPLVSVTF